VAVTAEQVEDLETASAVRRGIEVWYAAFGGIAAWTVHFVFVVSAEHWTFLHSEYAWTLHAATAVCAAATILAILLALRLHTVASGSDPSSNDDAGQLLFLAQVGLLVGAINLALILLEGAYAVFIPRG
jgi:hypothetical protein